MLLQSAYTFDARDANSYQGMGEAYYVLNYDQPEASYSDIPIQRTRDGEIRDDSVAKLTLEITAASEG